MNGALRFLQANTSIIQIKLPFMLGTSQHSIGNLSLNMNYIRKS
jgi:hypothetical protein